MTTNGGELVLTLATATVRDVQAVPVAPTTEGGYDWYSLVPVQGRQYHHAGQVGAVQPLTVLDLADPAGVADTLRSVLTVPGLTADQTTMLQLLIDDITGAATPPKPEEPLGLGAVVENQAGGAAGQWIRVTGPNANRPWMNRQTGEKLAYADVPAVRKLSDGVPV